MARCVIIFALVFLIPLVQATESKSQLIDHLIAQSGVRLLSAQAKQVVDLYSFTQLLNDQQKKLALKKILLHWSKTKLNQNLDARLNAYDQKQLLTWQKALNSSALQVLYKVEKKAIKEQFSKDYSQYILTLRNRNPREQRVKRISELVGLSHRFKWLWIVRKASFDALSSWYGNSVITLNSQRLRKRLVQFYLYAFRHHSDEQIEGIINEYEKPEVKKWLAAVTASLKSQSTSN